jgi:DNA-binding HxlR family transcriptional regulator
LERDGLLTRTVYAEVPPRVEYALTPLGETLIEPLAVLREWAEAHIDTILVAQTRYDHQHD